MTPRIYPSTDLHLLVGAVVTLDACMSIAGVWTRLSTQPSPTLQLFPNSGIVSVAGNVRQVTALSVGTLLATLRLQFGPPANPTRLNAALRVTVHHRMRRIFVPQAAITLESDRADRVLSVYAEFEAAGGVRSTHDVTSHPYLRYAVAVTSGSPNLTVDATGRVTSGDAAGSVRITISADPALAAAGPTATLDVTVVVAPADRPILARVHEGMAIRKRSILLLSEGFLQAEKPRFDQLVSAMTQRLLTAVSPYRLLRESFDVYAGFVPSRESGVTLAPPIVPRQGSAQIAFAVPPDQQLAHGDLLVEELLTVLGHPATNPIAFAAARTQMQGTHPQFALKQVTFDAWRSLATTPAAARVRETHFGFMIGERHFGTATVMRTPPPQTIADVALDLLLPREANRSPLFDDRRLPDLTAPGADPARAHLASQDRFVTTLRAPDGPPGFGAIWAQGGESYDLIVYLVSSDHYGGLRGEGYLAMSIGGGILLATAPSTLVPGLTDVAPVPRPIPAALAAAGFRDRPRDSLVDILAHELAHAPSLGSLGDEYGELTRSPTTAAEIAFVDSSPNTQTLADARGGAGTAVRGDRLKWNWERIEAAASVEDRADAGNFLNIVLVAADLDRWPPGSVGRQVFLRSKELSSTSHPRSPDLTVRSVDRTTHIIQLEVPPSTSAAALVIVFPPGSTLVLPRRDAGGALVRLVHPAVVAAMAAGPFDPSNATCQLLPSQGPPAAVAGFQFPANRRQTLAAYESASKFNCGAIRPAAECKMRTFADQPNATPVDFCFVCKYAMVDAVDPGAHGEIDKEFPR